MMDARYRTRRNSVSHITRHQFGMTEKLDTVRAQFETLHQAYIAELPYKIQRAREIWELLPDEGWDGDAWSQLHRLIHSLAGSGAIYGFPMLSAAARALDAQLK